MGFPVAAGIAIGAAVSALGSYLASKGSQGGGQQYPQPYLDLLQLFANYGRSHLQYQDGYSGYKGNMTIGASPLEAGIFAEAKNWGSQNIKQYSDILRDLAAGKGFDDITASLDKIAEWDIERASASVRAKAGVAGASAGSGVNRQIAGVIGNAKTQAGVQSAQYKLQGKQVQLGAAQLGLSIPDVFAKLAAVGAQQRGIEESNLTRRMQDYYWRIGATNQLIAALAGSSQPLAQPETMSSSGSAGVGMLSAGNMLSQYYMLQAMKS